MRPLEPYLLNARALMLHALAAHAAGPVEEILFERLMCDGCDLIVDLTQRFPSGWTTCGTLELGWTDLCPSCTRGEDGADTESVGRAVARARMV